MARQPILLIAAALLAAAAALTSPAQTSLAYAGPQLPEGKKTITLIAASGERQDIGHVVFTPEESAATFELMIDAPEFREEFLSMRPFSCLPGEKEMWCHLAYPYTLKRQITTSELTDLEYDLLFLFKPPTSYGIDPWNGLYFKMQIDDAGGISGGVHDVNLDPLGVPPKDKTARTIAPDALTASDPATHRFARIEIR